MTLDLAQTLRDAQLTTHEMDGWRTRGHGTVSFEGVMAHHTAIGSGDPQHHAQGMVDGRTDLAGPLCNLFLDRLGEWWVIAALRAYHAGKGSRVVLDELRRGIYPSGDAAARGLVDDYGTANETFVGIEVDNDGRGEPYPDVQLRSLERGCAALARTGLWLPIHHREHTRRKIDMSYRGDLRGAVRALRPGAESDDMTPEQEKKVDDLARNLKNLDTVVKAADSNNANRYNDLKAEIAKVTAGAVDYDRLATAVADKLAARLQS